jgi:hypothetical protein
MNVMQVYHKLELSTYSAIILTRKYFPIRMDMTFIEMALLCSVMDWMKKILQHKDHSAIVKFNNKKLFFTHPLNLFSI